MKATFTYDLNEHEEEQAVMRIMHASDMAGILWELAYNTRKELEFQMEAKEMTGYEVLDAIITKINDELIDRGINLERIYQ